MSSVLNRACERSGARAERAAERSYFLQSGERLSEDFAPLAQYAQRRSLSPKMPFGNLLVPESVE